MTTVLELDMRAPELTPWPSSLLDVVSAKNDANVGLRYSGDKGQYLSAGCLLPELGGFCGAPVSPKELNGLAEDTSTSFSVHALVSCKAVGVQDILRPELERAWNVGVESFGVERALVANILGTSATTDITATYGVSITTVATAIAVLEMHAGLKYNGLPILHLPIPLVSLALKEAAIEKIGDRLYTKLGSPVVAGRGYVDANGNSTGVNGAATTDGNYWAWVTGGIDIYANTVNVQEAFNAPATGSNNELTVLAERSYGLSVDCLIAGLHFQALTAGA